MADPPQSEFVGVRDITSTTATSTSTTIPQVDAPETALGSIARHNKVMNDDKDTSITSLWSNTLLSWSYASSFLPTRDYKEDEDDMLMVDSPETALGSIAVNELLDSQDTKASSQDSLLQQENVGNNETMYYMVNAPDTALGSIALNEVVDNGTVRQLQQQQDDDYNVALPRSLQEYYEVSSKEKHAMVVTSIQPPFQVVDVNDAWIGLCGYTRGESIDHSLGELLQGQETDKEALRDFLKKLASGQEATVTITNYTKKGRKFVNRVHAGPLTNNVSGETITHFVGVLQELTKEGGEMTRL